MDEKLLQKINDLLALGKSQVNEYEASLAMEMAERLLLKHNLTMSQVENLSRNEQAESAVGLDRWLWEQTDWKRVLVHGVSRAYLCKSITYGAYVSIIGRPENIAIAESVWKWIVPNIERMCMTEYLALPSGTRRGWKDSWLLGCASRLVERFAEVRSRHTSEETALVVGYAQENEDYVKAHWDTSPGRAPRTSIRTDAYSAGMAAGAGIGLGDSKSVGGGAPRLGSGR